jgi:hypothetical protein
MMIESLAGKYANARESAIRDSSPTAGSTVHELVDRVRASSQAFTAAPEPPTL